MDKLVRLHHGGNVLRTKDDSVELQNMVEDVVLFGQSPCLTQVVDRVRDRLCWSERDCDVKLEGVIDVGSSKGPRIKIVAPISCQSEWDAYKQVVMASEVRCLDLVVHKVMSHQIPTSLPFVLNSPTNSNTPSGVHKDKQISAEDSNSRKSKPITPKHTANSQKETDERISPGKRLTSSKGKSAEAENALPSKVELQNTITGILKNDMNTGSNSRKCKRRGEIASKTPKGTPSRSRKKFGNDSTSGKRRKKALMYGIDEDEDESVKSDSEADEQEDDYDSGKEKSRKKFSEVKESSGKKKTYRGSGHKTGPPKTINKRRRKVLMRLFNSRPYYTDEDESVKFDSEADEQDDYDSGKEKARKKFSEVKESSGKKKTDRGSGHKTGPPKTISKSPVKKASSKISEEKESSDDSGKVFSRKKTTGKDEKDIKEKKSSGKRVTKCKGESATVDLPSNDELRKTITAILEKVDFNTATFSDILKKLDDHYKMDLTPKKEAIKVMVQDELTKMSGADEDEDTDEDAGQKQQQPQAKEVEA